jgi:hypothetical protein
MQRKWPSSPPPSPTAATELRFKEIPPMCPLYAHSASETSPQKEIRRALAVLYRPSDVAELRAFGKRKTFAGWFDDFE